MTLSPSLTSPHGEQVAVSVSVQSYENKTKTQKKYEKKMKGNAKRGADFLKSAPRLIAYLIIILLSPL